jgi:hypothetical protein
VNEYAEMGFTHGVAMSDDGLIIAIGAHGYKHGGTTDVGKVQVFEYSTTNQTWTLRYDSSLSLAAAAVPRETSVVSLSSDGTILAVGGLNSDTIDILRWQPLHSGGAGYYSVCTVTGSVGQYLSGAGFGRALALSGDGMRLAVGSPVKALPDGAGPRGQVNVFKASDSNTQDLNGRLAGSELAPIANSYQGSEHTVWSLLDLSLVTIQALQGRITALENP